MYCIAPERPITSGGIIYEWKKFYLQITSITEGGLRFFYVQKNYCSIKFHIIISHFLLSTLKRYLVWSALDRVSSASVTMSHLIAYDPERDLLPLILAHCNYSLEVGQETLVHYDWAALERQLIDRFLRGRPFVEFKVSC